MQADVYHVHSSAMAEAFIALGIACNISQLIGQCIELGKIGKQVWENGSPESHKEIERSHARIQGSCDELLDELGKKIPGPQDARIKTIVVESRATARLLTDELSKIQCSRFGRPGEFLRILSKDSKIKALHAVFRKQQDDIDSIIIKDL